VVAAAGGLAGTASRAAPGRCCRPECSWPGPAAMPMIREDP